MPRFEETRRIICHNEAGRSVVIVEHQKWPVSPSASHSSSPVFDYLTEDGEVVSKVGENEYLLLLSDEMFLTA